MLKLVFTVEMRIQDMNEATRSRISNFVVDFEWPELLASDSSPPRNGGLSEVRHDNNYV